MSVLPREALNANLHVSTSEHDPLDPANTERTVNVLSQLTALRGDQLTKLVLKQLPDYEGYDPGDGTPEATQKTLDNIRLLPPDEEAAAVESALSRLTR